MTEKLFLIFNILTFLLSTAYAGVTVVQVSARGSTTLSCGISGGTISWHKISDDDFQISNGGSIVCCSAEPNKFSVASSGASLTINDIIGLDNAKYVCRRDYGTSSVYEDPNTYELQVQALVADSLMEVSYSCGVSSHCVEGQAITVDCNVFDVDPAPEMQWVQLTSPDADTYTILSNVNSPTAAKNENGLYNRTATLTTTASRDLLFNVLRCRATQTLSDNVNHTAVDTTPINIDVRFGPECSTTAIQKFGAEIGDTVSVSCVIDYNPLPTAPEECYWKTQNIDTATTITGSTVTASLNESYYLLTASYDYKITSISDYKTLYCFCNNINTNTGTGCPVKVVEPGLPDPPFNCRQANTTSYSANILCDAGFNGGSTPYYALDRMAAGDDVSTVRYVSGLTTPNYFVNDLQSSTTYQFRMCTTNSDFPDMQQCTAVFKIYTKSGTSAVVSTATIQWWIILVAIGGALLLIVVIMVIVFIVMPKKKDDDDDDDKKDKDKRDSDIESGVHPTISTPVLASSPPIELEDYPKAGDGDILEASALYAAAANARRSSSSSSSASSRPSRRPRLEIEQELDRHSSNGDLVRAAAEVALTAAAVEAIEERRNSKSSSDSSHSSHSANDDYLVPDRIEDRHDSDDHPHLGDGHLLQAGAAIDAAAAVAEAIEERRDSSKSSKSSHSSHSGGIAEVIEDRLDSDHSDHLGDGHILQAAVAAAENNSERTSIHSRSRKSSTSSSSSSSSSDDD